MNAKIFPSRLFKQLESLEPDDLDLVMEFVEFLQYKKGVRQEVAVSGRKNLSRLRGIAKPVSGLEDVDPQEDYVNYLVDKYQ